MSVDNEFFLDETNGPVRKYQVREALGGMGQLQAVLPDLTLPEAFVAFRTELGMQRRSSTINRLRQRIRALAVEKIDQHLKEMVETSLTQEEMQ